MKKYLPYLLGVIIIGGIAFALSNTNLFKGAIVGQPAVLVTVTAEPMHENGEFISGLSESDFAAYAAVLPRDTVPTDEITIWAFSEVGNSYELELDPLDGAGATAIYDLKIEPYGYVSAHSWGEPGDTEVEAPAVAILNPYAPTLEYGAIVTVTDEIGALRDDANVRITNAPDNGQNFNCDSLGNGEYGCEHYGSYGVTPLSAINAEVRLSGYTNLEHPMGWRLFHNSAQVLEAVQLEPVPDTGFVYASVADKQPSPFMDLTVDNFEVTDASGFDHLLTATQIDVGLYELALDTIGTYDISVIDLEGYVNRTVTGVEATEFEQPVDINFTYADFSMTHGYRVRLTDEAGVEITDATITLNGVDCTYLPEAGNPDVYGCILPIYDGANLPATLNGEASKAGYVTNNFYFLDEVSYRTTHAEPGIAKQITLKNDSDGDGLADFDEVTIYLTDPVNDDTDADGLSDGEEVLTYLTDPLVPDTDGGGIVDGEEVINDSTDPLDPTDDLVEPGEIGDGDNDGLNDSEESLLGTDPSNPDTDADGLTDGDEVNIHGTDPLDDDTDDGTVNDGDEVTDGTDPLDGTDDVSVVLPFPTPTPVPVPFPTPTTSACTDLDIQPDFYIAEDGENLQMTIEVNSDGDDWTDTLLVESDGNGDLVSQDGTVATTSIEIAVSGTTDTQVVDYNSLNIGDTITATSGDCSDSLTITEKAGKFDFLGELCEHPFLDVGTDWYQPYVCGLYQVGVVQGKIYNSYEPNSDVTIAEALKMLLYSAEIDVPEEAIGTYINHPDVDSSDWYYDVIKVAEARNILRTPSGAFVYPSEPATRSQIVVWASRLYEWEVFDYDVTPYCSDISNNDPFAYAFAYTADASVNVPGEGLTAVTTGNLDGTCAPYENVNRAEIAAWVVRFYLLGGTL